MRYVRLAAILCGRWSRNPTLYRMRTAFSFPNHGFERRLSHRPLRCDRPHRRGGHGAGVSGQSYKAELVASRRRRMKRSSFTVAGLSMLMVAIWARGQDSHPIRQIITSMRSRLSRANSSSFSIPSCSSRKCGPSRTSEILQVEASPWGTWSSRLPVLRRLDQRRRLLGCRVRTDWRRFLGGKLDGRARSCSFTASPGAECNAGVLGDR